MHKIGLLLMMLFTAALISAQDIIKLPVTLHDDNVKWETAEREYYSPIWATEVITNVSSPEMHVYRPDNPNGTAVIIAPGGGLYAQSIESEGRMVAKWLAERGVTGIVLKYRLVPTGEDGVAEISTEGVDRLKERLTPVFPLSFSDGLNAVAYVREHAEELDVNPSQIGFLGFSAGGAVTMGVMYGYDDSGNRPDFVAPIYAWTSAYPVQEVPTDAPPMFIACATDDPLDLAKGSVELYSSWLAAKKPVEMHMYAKGGHGFGMRPNGTPSDAWIERFGEWLKSNDWMK